MKGIEILSYKNGRVRLRTHKIFHEIILELLKSHLKEATILSNPYTNSITIYYKLTSLEDLSYFLEKHGFYLINKYYNNNINIFSMTQLILNIGGGLEGIAFNVAKDIILDKAGLKTASYFI